jgi:hypothetical protein
MLGTIKRRLASLERSIQPPLTAELFLSQAHEHARRTGATFDSACEALVVKLSDPDLQRLAPLMEDLAFGGDMAALAAAKHKVLMGFRDSETAATEV